LSYKDCTGCSLIILNQFVHIIFIFFVGWELV
jgi:hypothetical protein